MLHAMNKPRLQKNNFLFGMVLLLALTIRALLILCAQTNGGDWGIYERFADNILHGNGFSLSDPNSSVIVPSSGGYYPGFPAFIAVVWYLLGKSVSAVLWTQLALFVIVLYWLLKSLLRLTGNLNVVVGAGIFLALSPLTVGWSRFPLTESLAITSSLWFLAEIINSLAIKKLRVYHLAAALTTSIYIRPDNIFMVIAVLPVSFIIYQAKRESLKQIVILILLISIPVSAWMVRNVLIGRSPLSMHEGTGPYPIGYRAWVNTWAVTENERNDAVLCNPPYAKFRQSRFLTAAESRKASALIAQSLVDDSNAIADSVDAQFQELANEKLSKTGLLTTGELYITKSYNLLFSPFSVWGLPVAIGDIDKIAVLRAVSSVNIEQLNALLSNHITAIFRRLLAYIYQVLFFVSFFMLLLSIGWKALIKKTLQPYPFHSNLLVSVSALVMFARLAFFVAIGGLESRYLVEAIPWMECSLALSIFSKGDFFGINTAEISKP